MKIAGYAKEIADFFALGYYSDAYFKVEIERVPTTYNNGNVITADKFPSDPPKHGEDCRPASNKLKEFALTEERKQEQAIKTKEALDCYFALDKASRASRAQKPD